MKVKLQNQWFGPDGFRYREGVQDVPSAFKDKLPATAEILEEAKADDEDDAPKPAPKK
jgi:hypothetical protein